MEAKLKKIHLKFKLHIKITLIAASLHTVDRDLISHQLELFVNCPLIKLYTLWHILKKHIFNHMMTLVHGNYKINKYMNAASHYRYQKEALDAMMVPHGMFKYILSSLTFDHFYCAKSHIIFTQKVLGAKLKEIRNV